MVTQVVANQALGNFVFFNTQTRPLLVNDVGQNGKFLPRLDVMLAPIVRQLVARLLTRHALLNPFFAAAMLLPCRPRTVERQSGVGHFLHALIAHLGQPELDGLGFGAGHRLDDAQERGCFSAIGFTLLAICSG